MKAGKKDRVFELVTTVLLAVILIIALYPLYFSLIASISSPRAVYQGRVLFGSSTTKIEQNSSNLWDFT